MGGWGGGQTSIVFTTEITTIAILMRTNTLPHLTKSFINNVA